LSLAHEPRAERTVEFVDESFPSASVMPMRESKTSTQSTSSARDTAAERAPGVLPQRRATMRGPVPHTACTQMKRTSAEADDARPQVPGTDSSNLWSPLKTAGN
jgi:hypothetical protein